MYAYRTHLKRIDNSNDCPLQYLHSKLLPKHTNHSNEIYSYSCIHSNKDTNTSMYNVILYS